MRLIEGSKFEVQAYRLAICERPRFDDVSLGPSKRSTFCVPCDNYKLPLIRPRNRRAIDNYCRSLYIQLTQSGSPLKEQRILDFFSLLSVGRFV